MPQRIDQLITEVHAIRREVHELRDRQSVRKNGHTWRQYLDKWITPQSVGWIAVLALQGFLAWQNMRSDVDRAAAVADKAATAATTVTEAQDRLAKQLGARAVAVDERLDAIQQRQDTYATKADVAAVKELQKLAVTRREFRESVDAQQQMIQRLVRIESSVREKP